MYVLKRKKRNIVQSSISIRGVLVPMPVTDFPKMLKSHSQCSLWDATKHKL